MNIYPGAKVAYAYRTGDTSILNNEEHRLYNTAVKIVNAAKSQPTDLRKELYIHEKITDSVSYFFETKQVANYRNTYLSSYATKSNGYTFGNLSILISNMYRNKLAGKASENWNKVTLIPVEATYSTVSSTSTVLTKVTHDMSMSSTKLQNNDLKISVIYSRK